MHLKDEQVARLAERIILDLTSSGLIQLKSERGAALKAVKAAISSDLKQEEALERDAETLLDQTLRSMGSGASGIDRHKMFRMIKDKLAKDRNIIL